MSASNSLAASQPHINATVSASAGSGKTWLLITRIVRLLLAGAEPGSILALTFTRKAAAEMQIRLNERLYQLASCDDDELISMLEAIQTEASPENQQRARSLYEQSLHSLHPVRLQTFHSFCQDILARFPLEANVPPGFELLDDTSLLEQQAWEELFTEATLQPDSALTQSLDFLMQENNSVANLRTSLSSMLSHRSDWWAYTFDHDNPVEYAHANLRQQLELLDSRDPVENFFNDFTRIGLSEFAKLLRKHATKTNDGHAEIIEAVLSESVFDINALNKIRSVFLTASDEPRARKLSNAQEKSMTSAGQDQFLEIHDRLSAQLIETLDYLKRLRTLAINQAWYFSGQRFIEIFQRIKRELRMLDFTDLEWHCYQLLNTSDNALWVQYKVDQRIDHFLIDEFQDTNPTQWQLLAPLFEEMAAGSTDRWRTAFLVGDEKQSIYGFRRANPALQAQASAWLAEHLNAQAAPLDFSWRSSPAIIQFVNGVFQQTEVQALMPNFSEHDTHLKTLPGRVTVFPLCQPAEEADEPACTELRNPLLEPRKEKINTQYQEEAKLIAAQIKTLTNTPHYIKTDRGVRAINHGDIMILVKARKPIKEYEQALRERNIPFISDKRGTLLDNLEIRDLEKLLDSLITPFDNLAIAQVLKSPIFDASDEDLITMARIKDAPHWYDRLQMLPETFDVSHPLVRAARLLPRWHALADTIPVHDLLDRIYAEANLLQRYAASVDETLKLRVQANLQRFLELSLELDAGRYPSLSHFLHYLRSLRKPEASSPNEPNVNEAGERVTILTIHASKGLEAPVVFLADCNRGSNNNEAYSTLVDWPADSQRPERMQLVMSKPNTDSLTLKVQDRKAEAQAREQLNLLYVALTRAREYLFISGVASKKTSSGWYDLSRKAIASITEGRDDGSFHYVFSEHQVTVDNFEKTPATSHSQLKIMPELLQPIKSLAKPECIIAPSKANREQYSFIATSDLNAEHGQIRGIAIHRALELLSGKKTLSNELIRQILLTEFQQDAEHHQIEQWLDEAQKVFNDIQFKMIFSPGESVQSFNELPLLYDNNGQSVYGLIDRLILGNNEILLIDYKTHAQASTANSKTLAASFSAQMNLYSQGIQKIWPDHKIKKGILFTASQTLIWLDE
ncbi:MAG: UvrD-helicase domain-containing protein [Gammaproteobacteria bacterium]|nr:UvrD-helicase domain-containing protein [Gammaproteobacteria bacterium]